MMKERLSMDSTDQINGFAHVCVSATDLDATRHFYCEGLGCEKVFNFIRDGEVVGFYLEIAERDFVEVFQREEIDPNDTGPINHICLEVSDIDSVRQRLSANGYDVTDSKYGKDHSRQAWTTDPDGVEIEFHEYTEKSSQLTGEDCVLD